VIAALLLLATVAGACMSPVTPEPAPPPPTTQPTDVREIMDIVWQWNTLSEAQPPAESTIANPEQYTITFLPQNQVSIKADCNMVHGIYAAAGDRLTIQLGPSTMAFCGEQSNDQVYLDLLTRVSTFALADGVLKLTTTDENVIGFANGGAPQAEAPAAPPFVNAVWEWEAFRSPEESMSFNVVEPEKYLAVFVPEGLLALRADCNRAAGNYTADGASLAITLGPTTLAECGPDSLYDVYLRNFANVASYVMDGDRLILNLKMDSGDMVFRRAQVVPGISITPNQVSLDTQGLPYSWQANLVAETPYDASQPPGPMGMPEHLEINFGGVDPADVQPNDPIMYILPVNAYRAQWQAAGNDFVTQQMANIYQMLVTLPVPSPDSLPTLPPEQTGGVNDVAVQVSRVNGVTMDSASRDGYRFVGRWAQDANPITNGRCRYPHSIVHQITGLAGRLATKSK
jgi:heat shock protein HslJ